VDEAGAGGEVVTVIRVAEVQLQHELRGADQDHRERGGPRRAPGPSPVKPSGHAGALGLGSILSSWQAASA
jgi:hypothetical protein